MIQDSDQGFRWSRLKFFFNFLLSAIVFLLIVFSIDFKSSIESMDEIPFYYLYSIIFVFLINIFVVSLRLYFLLDVFKTKISMISVIKANISGFLTSLYMFSVLGSILGRQVILRRHAVRVGTVTLVTAYERILLVCGGGGMFLIGLLVLFGEDVFWSLTDRFPFVPLVMTVVASGFVALNISRSRFETAIIKELLTLRSLLDFTKLSFLTLLGQGLTVFSYVIALKGIGSDVSLINMLAAGALVSFIASFPLSVNGWGIRELASVYVFGAIGVTSFDAVAVSIVVGLCSSFAVLLLSPVLWIKDPATHIDSKSKKSSDSESIFGSGVEGLYTKFCRILPMLVALFLFFQIRAEWGGNVITLNIADVFAILGLIFIVLVFVSEFRLLVVLRLGVWHWLIVVTAVLLLAFAYGATQFGVTSWALNNRVFGWFILMGYFVVGAMMVTSWGNHGLRRLGEVLVATSACVTVANMGMQVAYFMFDLDVLIDQNFQGFSGNRNAFAFQLIISFCFALALSRRYRSAPKSYIWLGLSVMLLHGLWQTQSTTGFVTASVIIAIAYIIKSVSLRYILILAASFLAFQVVMRGGIALAVNLLDLSSDLGRIARKPEVFNIESLNERWESLYSGVEMWLSSPILGAGLGAFIHVRETLYENPLLIHSIPIWLLAEFGLLGTLAILSFPILLIFGAIRQGTLFRPKGTGLLTLLVVSIAVFGLTHDVSYQRIFWLALGASLGVSLASLRLMCQTPLSRDRPIKVLHMISSLNQGGAETMLLNLVRLKSSDVEARVVSLLSHGVFATKVRETGTELTELNFGKYFPNLIGFGRLVYLICRFKPDVIQGWMYHADLAALIALYASGRRRRTRLVWGVRCSDMDLSRYSWRLRVVVWFCVRLSSLTDCVIANSRSGLNVHAALGYRPPSFEVVQNGINIDRFKRNPNICKELRHQFGIPSDARVLAHVARLDAMKDHAGFFEALKIASQNNLWVLLVGKNTENLDQMPQVIALGPRDDIPEILSAADGVVSSSAYGEGFSNALVEGMSCSLVPIATDVGDSSEIVSDIGWVVPPRNPTALAQTLNDFALLSEEEMVLHLHARAIELPLYPKKPSIRVEAGAVYRKIKITCQ
jgi:glycosyltransferase involved in cell wall biosynthesis/uncharacterized membrane protein YbhN (UPF0104 family)